MKKDESKKSLESNVDIEKDINEMLDRGIMHHKILVANAELNLAFIDGRQYVGYSKQNGIEPVANSSSDIRCMYNRMGTTFERRLEYMFKTQPVLTSFEGGKELRDTESSLIASSLCEYMYSQCGLKEAQEEMQAWTDVAGLSFIAPVLRKNPYLPKIKKQKTYSAEEIKKDGKISFLTETEHVVYDDDLNFDVFSPLSTFTFPVNARKWNEVRSVMTVQIVGKEFIEDRIGKKLDEKLDTAEPSDLNIDAIEQMNQILNQDMSGTKQEDRYKFIEYREKPSFKHKNGRYIVMVADKIIEKSDLPYIDIARELDPSGNRNLGLGLIPLISGKSPNKLYPVALFTHLREPQKRINETLTDIVRNRKTVGRNKIITGTGSLNEDNFTSEHGEIIEIDASGTAPQMFEGKPLVGIGEEYQRDISIFDDVSGFGEIMRGNNPSNIRSAWHFDLVKEESGGQINGAVKKMESVFETIGQFSLCLMKKYFDEKRLMQIVGSDVAGMVMQFKESQIRTDIRVKVGSAIPRNHASRQQQLIEMLQYGAFVDPITGKNNTSEFMRMMELGTLNRTVNSEEMARVRARNENNAIVLKGDVIEPLEIEDHIIHIEEHQSYMGRKEFYDATPAKRAIIIAHLRTHGEYARLQVAPETFNQPPQVKELPPVQGSNMQNIPPELMNNVLNK